MTNILPSIIQGYMYADMYNLDGGDKISVGGFPVTQLVSDEDSDTMTGGARGLSALSSLVVPIGLVNDVRLGQRSLEYKDHGSVQDFDTVDESLFDKLFTLISPTTGHKQRPQSRKIVNKPSKRKSLRIRNSEE